MDITFPSIGQFFKDFTIDYKPKGTINRDVLYELLQREFPDVEIFLINPYNELFSEEQYNKFIKWDFTDQRIWTPKDNCWCFATQLHLHARRKLGNPAFGKMIIPGHALNVMVTEELKVKIIEPQNDGVVSTSIRRYMEM